MSPAVSLSNSAHMAVIRGLSTAQLVLSTVSIGAQVGLFFICYTDSKCLIYPASASTILYLFAAISGVVAGACWKRYLIVVYLVMSNLAVTLTAIMAILSYGPVREEFWRELGYPGRSELQILTVWLLLVTCLGEVLLFTASVLACGFTLSQFEKPVQKTFEMTLGDISRHASLQT